MWFYQLACAFQWPSRHCSFFPLGMLTSQLIYQIQPLLWVLYQMPCQTTFVMTYMYVHVCMFLSTYELTPKFPAAQGRADRTQTLNLSKQGQKLAVSLTNSMILGFLLNLSRPQFPDLFYVYHRVLGTIK